MKNSLQMEKIVLLYTCNMLHIFRFKYLLSKKFNQRNLIKKFSQIEFQKNQDIFFKESVLLLYILVNL